MKITMIFWAVFQNGIRFPKWEAYGKMYLNLAMRFDENKKCHSA
jgi:hypothetical protein